MKKLITAGVIVLAVIIIVFIVGPFYILEEGEQAVIVRFGEVIRTDTDADLKFKVPFVDTVKKFPKKILAWDGAAQIIPTTEGENQFIWVDTTARWKIIDLKLFYASVGTLTDVLSRLDDIIDSSVRQVISQNFLIEAIRNTNDIYDKIAAQLKATPGEDLESYLIAKGRTVLGNDMLSKAQTAMEATGTDGKEYNQYGIELLDIVIRQIKYSDDLTSSVYERMIQERRQAAEKIRSEGLGEKANILGSLTQEVDTIRSTAYNEAETIKGTADAEATRIYADAYNQNEGFFKLWRSLESYKKTLPQFKKTLTTDADYFNYLYDSSGR